jgi:ferritin-like metal-binding protein YciE
MLAFEILPKLQHAVTGETLHGIVGEHLEQTKEHVARLEQVFRAAGAEPSSNLYPPIEQLAQHHEQIGGSIPNDRLADVYHAAAASTTERIEISAYDALVALAQTLDLGDARGLLEQTRKEELDALEKLQGELERLAAPFGSGTEGA